MIFYDPTEARSSSLLHEDVIASGSPLKNLEQVTGADILVSPLSKPNISEITDTRPSQLAFKLHADSGLFVQRKSGTDACNSVEDFGITLAMMMEHAKVIRPWLLLVGTFREVKGRLVIDRHKTKWSYMAFQGALDMWQTQTTEESSFIGGGVTILSSEDLVLPWLKGWERKINFADYPKIILPRKKNTVISGFKKTDSPWRMTLSTLPGIGSTLSTQVGTYCGSLSRSLSLLTDTDNVKLKGSDKYPQGITENRINTIKEWFGLDEDERMAVIKGEEETL